MSCRRLGSGDWELYRRIRLEALREAPYAFGSTFEREASFDDDAWRDRVTERVRFVADVDGTAAGTVSIGDSDVEGVAAITAMWVDPRFRRHGVGSALIRCVLEWARAHPYSRILLWVTEGNTGAESLYASHGFARTGSVDAVRPGEDRVEYEMARTL